MLSAMRSLWCHVETSKNAANGKKSKAERTTDHLFLFGAMATWSSAASRRCTT